MIFEATPDGTSRMVRWVTPLSADLPEPVREFKRALRFAIDNAGFRTLKDLKERARISESMVSEAAGSSLTMPTPDVLTMILQTCGSNAPASTRYESWKALYKVAGDAARAAKSSLDHQAQIRPDEAGPRSGTPKARSPLDHAGQAAQQPATLWDVIRQDPSQREALAIAVVNAAKAHEQSDNGHADRLVAILDDLLAPWLADVSPAEAALLLLVAHHHGIEDRLAAYLNEAPSTLLTWRGIPLAGPVMTLCHSVKLPAVKLRGPEFDSVASLDADLRFCAVVLRIAELFEVADGRPPSVVRQHVGLTAFTRPVSGDVHASGLVFPGERPTDYAISLLARPNHPSVEHDLRHYLAAVDGELSQCRALRLDPHLRQREIALPGRASTDCIYASGYRYGEFRFELDRTAILELFMGEDLYDDPYVFVRELMQNAFDATRLRHHLHGEEPDQRVAVTCWQDETGYLWVRVDDPGIGMDEQALRAYLLRVGRSYYQSPEFEAEFAKKGRDRAGFTPISRFGIGVLTCFMVGDRVEVSTRRLYADGTLATPLRLSLNRDVDYFVLREEGMPAGSMPAWSPADATPYRQACGTSIAVRVHPLRAQVTLHGVAKALDQHLFCPPIPVTFNEDKAGKITDDLIDHPWVDGARIVEVPSVDRLPTINSNGTPSQDRLPYFGPLRVAVIPMDLTRHSATPMLRGQMIGVYVLADQETSDLLVGLKVAPGDPQLMAVRKLLRTAVTKLEFSTLGWGLDGSDQQLQIGVKRSLDPDTIDRAIEMLHPGASQRPATGTITRKPARTNLYGRSAATLSRQSLMDLLTYTKSSGSHNAGYTLSTWFMVDWVTLRDPKRPLALPEGAWLGHNGIAIPRALTERAQEHTLSEGCVLQAGGRGQSHNMSVRGVVALSDTLRPDVSVSRNQLRYVPFGVHSALHLAVRRAVAPLRGGPFENFAQEMIRQNLIDIPPAGRFTTTALTDPLIDGGEWDNEPMADFYRQLSISDMRRRFLDGERAETYFDPVESWTYDESDADAHPFQFHEVISNALLQTRLQLALRVLTPNGKYEDDNEYEDEKLIVVGVTAPKPSPGEAAFPPLTFLPFVDGSPQIRSRYGGWNLQHPVIVWIIKHAEELSIDLPAAYDRICVALAAPRSWGYVEFEDPAKELDEVLTLIGRLRPDLAPPDMSGFGDKLPWSRLENG